MAAVGPTKSSVEQVRIPCAAALVVTKFSVGLGMILWMAMMAMTSWSVTTATTSFRAVQAMTRSTAAMAMTS